MAVCDSEKRFGVRRFRHSHGTLVQPPDFSYDPLMPDPAPVPRPAVFLLLYSVLAVAVLYLVWFDLTPDAPIRGGGAAREQAIEMNSALGRSEANVRQLADGHPVALHLTPPAVPLDKQSAMRLAGFYYFIANGLYPARIYVGQDDRIVNDDRGLAGPPASRDWLISHGVRTTLECRVDEQQQLRSTAVPVR
jgi:hypothetical protein